MRSIFPVALLLTGLVLLAFSAASQAVAGRPAAGDLALVQSPAAPTAADSLVVTWSPAAPRQGSLFTVRVALAEGGSVDRPTGLFGSEPLHFVRDQGGGGWWAMAAVPVDQEGPGVLQLTTVAGAGVAGSGAHRREVPIAPGAYRMERLTVAPGFTQPPSAALAARMASESERAMAVARGAHDTPRMWQPEQFVLPRSSRITSGFGNGREFNGVVQSRHMGTDFAGAVGEPIVAPADGVVRIVDEFYLGGRVVYVDHGAGLSTAYLHLSAAGVAVGDTVRAGQRIGSVGATGRVTGPHLHWIVRYGGVTVDPMTLLEIEVPGPVR